MQPHIIPTETFDENNKRNIAMKIIRETMQPLFQDTDNCYSDVLCE